MKCPNCGQKISFSYFLAETLNIFCFGKHICLHCKNSYSVDLKVFYYFCFSVGVGRCLSLLLAHYTEYNNETVIFIYVIMALFIYLCCIIQQIIFYCKH